MSLSRRIGISTALVAALLAAPISAFADAKATRITVDAQVGEPSWVFVDGKRMGEAPIVVNVRPGTHVVAVLDPEGTQRERKVRVSEGENLPVYFGSDPSIVLATYRDGAHVGIGIGPMGTQLLGLGKQIYGVSGSVFFNYGLSPTFELRTGISLDASGSQISYMGAGVPTNLRININSVESLMVGFSIGLMTDTSALGFYAGPEWSFLTFRFGNKREFELGLDQGVHFHLGRVSTEPDFVHFQSTLVLRYLYLDQDR